MNKVLVFFQDTKLVHVLLYDCFAHMLFWDDISIIWDENIVYFLHEKKKLFWTIRSLGIQFSSTNYCDITGSENLGGLVVLGGDNVFPWSR